jgi:hypothetical protein
MGERASSATLWLSAFGLGAFFLCLEVIGPPPRFRIDALWVLRHARAVRMMVACAVAAAVLSLLLLALGRSRWTILAMWAAAAAIAFTLYWDRLEIIRAVLMRHGW